MIASAFPGLFSYRELVEMDVRDKAFWIREASAQIAQNELRMMVATSHGMGGGDEAKKQMRNLQGTIRNAHRNQGDLQKAKDARLLSGLKALRGGNTFGPKG